MLHRAALWVFVLAGLVSCGVGGKKQVVDKSLNALPEQERHESFEATARVLDEHPEMVDELYAVVRRHPPMLDRFLSNTARDLKDPALARFTADHLVREPASLEQVMNQTTAAAHPIPDARAAIRRGVVARASEATDILTDDADTLARLVSVSLDMIEEKPAARRAVLAAMRKERKRVLAFVREDPELVQAIGRIMLAEVVRDKPALDKALRAAKVLPPIP